MIKLVESVAREICFNRRSSVPCDCHPGSKCRMWTEFLLAEDEELVHQARAAIEAVIKHDNIVSRELTNQIGLMFLMLCQLQEENDSLKRAWEELNRGERIYNPVTQTWIQ